jgi:hypothetical protein
VIFGKKKFSKKSSFGQEVPPHLVERSDVTHALSEFIIITHKKMDFYKAHFTDNIQESLQGDHRKEMSTTLTKTPILTPTVPR